MTNDKQRVDFPDSGENVRRTKGARPGQGRLVELLIKYDAMRMMLYSIEDCADRLLENGIIVPPCKVGDTVWYINKHPHISLFKNSVYKAEVVRIVTTGLGTSLVIQIKSEGCCEIPNITDWGKTVFPTREEAEQALVNYGSSKNDVERKAVCRSENNRKN